MQSPFFTIIEVTGHIVDSLTLAKVIDKIQHAGCEYQINDFQIGQQKNDISYAQISLWTADEAAMKTLLEELKSYGAKPVESGAVHLEPCPEDGFLPKGAYARINPPTEVFYHGEWLKVNREGFDLAIIIDLQTRQARFQKVSELKQGDLVVVGKAGIKVLPTLGETANAQPVAG